jgi:2'-5' RNA ligase
MSIRSFIAIECTSIEIKSKISGIQKTLITTNADLKCVQSENIHLTLMFLGDVKETQIEEVKQIVRQTSFEPFHIDLQGVGVFPNLKRPRTIWAGIQEGNLEIKEIKRKLEKELAFIGFKTEKRKFHPHFTICRVRNTRHNKLLLETLLDLNNVVIGEQTVDRITLKKSVLTPRGPIYTVITESQH